MMEPVTAYPLSWPAGQGRTGRRQEARFSERRTIAAARDEMLAELERLHASRIVISSNLQLRQDGLPRGNQARPSDPGVAVYFQLKNEPHVFACDRWDTVEDNLWAIRLHIQALRGTERWGVGRTNQVFTGYRALPPGRTDAAMTAGEAAIVLCGYSGGIHEARSVLSSETVCEATYRDAVKKHHPDAGGDHDDFVRLQEAKRVLDEHHAGKG
jgi:hypothetical protein